jgi:YVTN family beta-propeller protein
MASTTLALIAAVASPVMAKPGEYLGPCCVEAAEDGKTLYVLNADAKQIAVVDAAGKVQRQIALPEPPTGMALSPDGKTLYVTCASPQGTICIVEAASGKVTATLPAGHWAVGPSVSPDGKRLYVCNRFDNNVAVYDLAAKKEIAKVTTTREPIATAVTPDGKAVFVSNHLPLDPADGYDVAAVVTAIDTSNNKATAIRLPNGSSSVRGITVSPDGKYVYAVHILARYQMPTTQLERGWMNTNAMTVIDAAAKKIVNTVLLDDVDLGAANPWDVACTADGSQICVTHAGTHEVSVIDAPALLEKLLAMPEEVSPEEQQKAYSGSYSSLTVDDVPNDLAFLVGLRHRVKLEGNGARGLAVAGNKAYCAMYFTDNLSIVDLAAEEPKVVADVALGPKPELTAERRGEMYFHDADLCFQNWQSCSSCHPDARVDALNWDLMNDGMGNPKNVRSMLLAHKTPPSMGSGVRSTAEVAVRSGITHIQFAVRPEEDAVAIDEYLKALEPVPSPHLVNGQLSESAKRGKELFFSEKIGCSQCHPEPLYTDLQMHDVGSRGKYDRRDDFDTPTLIECWRTAPYMHDGKWLTIEDLIAKGKHGAKGGDIDSLTPEQLKDLAEFVLSL